jgi:molybdate/tungstate transport system substrate-binding protein
MAAFVAPMALSLAQGCGASAPPVSSAPSTTPPDRGPVSVLYAGSLTGVMETRLGPALRSATGVHLDGVGAGSQALANDIKAGIYRGDVFLSAGTSVDDSLRGPANGKWLTWDAAFARTELVLGYNPHSAFADRLRSRPWYEVVTSPGLRLGRTDPVLDPKGTLTVKAVQQAATELKDPGLVQVLQGTGEVFPEETLVGRLQAGQLDAGFFYLAEAKAAGIPTVPLSPIHVSATYTVTVLRGAPHPAGAQAFVRFLVGPTARRILGGAGLVLVEPPAITGTVPSGLRAALGLR